MSITCMVNVYGWRPWKGGIRGFGGIRRPSNFSMQNGMNILFFSLLSYTRSDSPSVLDVALQNNAALLLYSYQNWRFFSNAILYTPYCPHLLQKFFFLKVFLFFNKSKLEHYFTFLFPLGNFLLKKQTLK